jgi:DMSO/TMAO reductase YedYZ molybdopterin-dependent catalytic subunit
MKKRLIVIALIFALLMTFPLAAYADSGLPQEDVSERTSWDKNEQADEKYAPRVVTMDNGVQVQKTPFNDVALDTQAGDVESKTIASWNNYFLNADNRGCTACHTIEDALESMETYHGIIYYGYNVEQGLQNCFGCHSFYDNYMRDAIHTLHERNSTFKAMGGSCESCHYIARHDDGTIEYQRWDYVKYDVLRGIADLPAEEMNLSFEWNQTEVTPHEKMFFKTIKSNPETWLTKESQVSQEDFDKWTITLSGDIDNGGVYTLPELIEKYGTETRLMKSHCTVNGPGQGMIYQAEITGVPLKAIVEDIGLHDDVLIVEPVGSDGYYYPISLETMLKEEALLVVGMNGDTIYADQGWPCAFWCNEMSAGNFTKQLAELRFVSVGASWDFYGDFVDATTGLQFDKPNVGVLTAYDGQIFELGQPVHLEGYADAWNEPIVKLEFSFDHGQTWQEYAIEDANTTQWVYWKLDINDLPAGSYLIKIRVSSQMADGSIRTNDVPNQMTNFMFNVQ